MTNARVELVKVAKTAGSKAAAIPVPWPMQVPFHSFQVQWPLLPVLSLFHGLPPRQHRRSTSLYFMRSPPPCG